jgi:hypothetical protein
MKLLTRLITLDMIIHLVLLWCYFGQIEYDRCQILYIAPPIDLCLLGS